MMIISALTPPPPGLLLSSDPCAPSASLYNSSNDLGPDGAAALSTSLAGLTSMQTLEIRCGRPPPTPPPPSPSNPLLRVCPAPRGSLGVSRRAGCSLRQTRTAADLYSVGPTRTAAMRGVSLMQPKGRVWARVERWAL